MLEWLLETAMFNNPTKIDLVPAKETTTSAIPLSIPMKRNVSAPAEKAPPANMITSEVMSISNLNQPHKAKKIQLRPKISYAMKFMFINTMTSSLLVQYLERIFH